MLDFRRYSLSIPLLAACLAVWMVGAAHAAEAVTAHDIAVVDVQKILRESAATRTIRPQMDQLKKKYEERFRKTEHDLRAASQDLQRQRAILSPQAYEAQRKAFQKRATAAQREVQGVRRQLDGALAMAMRQVHGALRNVTAEYARDRGLKLILPKSGVLLMETRFDITAEILKRLNAKLPSVTVAMPSSLGKKDANE